MAWAQTTTGHLNSVKSLIDPISEERAGPEQCVAVWGTGEHNQGPVLWFLKTGDSVENSRDKRASLWTNSCTPATDTVGRMWTVGC